MDTAPEQQQQPVGMTEEEYAAVAHPSGFSEGGVLTPSTTERSQPLPSTLRVANAADVAALFERCVPTGDFDSKLAMFGLPVPR
jgi:hypothetical protein